MVGETGGGVDALAVLAGNAAVSRGDNDGDAEEAELKELQALAAEIGGGQGGFVPAIREGDDLGGGEGAAVGSQVVAARD